MLDKIHAVPARIGVLRTKLAARQGQPGYKANCEAIRAEIGRLEAVTQKQADLVEFIESNEPVASGENQE